MSRFLFYILPFLFFSKCYPQAPMDKQKLAQGSIIEAVRKKQLDLVATMLKNGEDVNTRDESERSLLLIASHTNDIRMAKLLVSHGADVNQQDDMKDSPFLYAGASGYVELVQLFLGNGARFDIFNRYNGTALIPACERGYIDVERILVNTQGFPIDHVNRLGWTALMEAVVLGDGSKKYQDVVQALIDAGCDINIPDNDGVTALQHAGQKGFSTIAEKLKKASN
jgi:ankyrin repeat protein